MCSEYKRVNSEKEFLYTILIYHRYFKLKWEVDTWNNGESISLTIIVTESTTNVIDHRSIRATTWRILLTSEDSARIPVILMNSFILGWSVKLCLLSHNGSMSDFQTFLWLFSLLILRLLRDDNCFYLFIFNSWSINTPGNMIHQPLSISRKETGLSGATKTWFWRGAVWFHSFNSLLFSLESLKDVSE